MGGVLGRFLGVSYTRSDGGPSTSNIFNGFNGILY